MDALTQIAQFILSLSILIILHEMGHFIPARLFKTRVEKFYLFFDPWFSLFKVKKGDTEYGIGWLPLGGYVKISGMIDESMDKEQMKQAPQPWEFRAKPAWQRLIIMIGGVTVNVILGILIYAMVLFTWGEEYLPTKNASYGIATDSIGMKMGLMDGDKIISVDNKLIDNFNKIPIEIILNKGKTIELERNGEIVKVLITEEALSQFIKSKGVFIQPRFPAEIDSVIDGMAAAEAGLIKGDKILAINNQEAVYFNQVTSQLQQNKGQEIELTINRGGDSLALSLLVSEDGKLGFINKGIDTYLSFATKKYGWLEAIPAGANKGYETLESYAKQIKMLFTIENAHQSIGGFITIGKAYDKNWNWERFWNFTAFLSIALAFMNILPIPALDGGHVMFLLYEVITGRPPHEKVMEYAQYAGMILLLTLLLYANGNDVVRLFSGQ